MAVDNLEKQNRVRISDLDINLHTNNVKYIKWIIDSYDLDFVMNEIPFSVEINYLAESCFNDDIIIPRSEDKNNKKIFNHTIPRYADNTELCRMRIGWKNKYQ